MREDFSELSDAPRTSSRFVLAGVAAFLLPGLLVLLLGAPFLAPEEWNPGGLPSPSFAGWLMLSASFSVLGGILASPLIGAALITWAILHRRHLTRPWVFGFIGLAAGCAMGLLFAAAVDFSSWSSVGLFSSVGVLTGLAVWLIAYAGVTRPMATVGSKVS